MKENFGVVPAIVTSLDDPKKQGRIKLKFPKLSSSLESAWAPVAAPLAGKQRGAFFMPERGDEVLVAIEDGRLAAEFPGSLDHPAIWPGPVPAMPGESRDLAVVDDD